jgi:hypothetical protein
MDGSAMTTPSMVTVSWDEWTGTTWMPRATDPLDSAGAAQYLAFLRTQQVTTVRHITTS